VFEQPPPPGDLADGGRFPAGDDQAVEGLKLLRKPHLYRFYANACKYLFVFDKRALER
jgi:hypothetical protein